MAKTGERCEGPVTDGREVPLGSINAPIPPSLMARREQPGACTIMARLHQAWVGCGDSLPSTATRALGDCQEAAIGCAGCPPWVARIGVLTEGAGNDPWTGR